MKLSVNKKEQSNVDKQIAELQEMLKGLESKKQSLVQDESKINAVINNNKSLLANQDFFIECMEKNEKLFAGVVRKEYNIDSSIPDTTIISVLRTRIYDLNSSKIPKSGDDIMKEVDEESKRSGIKNPFSCLKDFEFQVSPSLGTHYRRRTKSDLWNYIIKNNQMYKMSEPDMKNYTDTYFNEWSLYNVIVEGSTFTAVDQKTGELFNDTLNTLNPNVVIFRNADDKVYSLVSRDGYNLKLVNDENPVPYFNLGHYLQMLIYCAVLYFDNFDNYMIAAVNKFKSADVYAMLNDPARRGFSILKCFDVVAKSKAPTYKLVLARQGDVKLVFDKMVVDAQGNYVFNKTSINSFIDKVLRSVYPDSDVDNFYKSIEMYGVFDTVAQGDYKIYKENSISF